jgi:DNA invertase Pin-like site-specific DNA recombinase
MADGYWYVGRMGHLLGYARVSTGDQDAALQQDALKAAGCYRIFTDTASGSLESRLELTKVLDQLRPGDTLVVWRLDRLGRSIRHLIDQLAGLQEQGIGFRSLQESIDTTSSGGRLVFHVFAALAEFERDLIRERTNAGLQAARARGRAGGRPALLTKDKLRTARRLYEQQEMTVEKIGEVLGVSRTTVYRALRREPAPSVPRRRSGQKTVR